MKLIKIIILLFLAILIIFLFANFFNQNKDAEEQGIVSQELTDQEIKERIGQMLIIGFRGTEISDDSDITKTIQDLNIGGVILFDYDVPSKSFPRNIINPSQVKKLTTDLQKFSALPLIIAVDAEGGSVNRLKEKYGFIYIPSHQELKKQGDSKSVEVIAQHLSQQLADLNINMNLAPVVDLNINPNNPIIGSLGRSFSNDPDEVVDYALAFIEGHQKNNIITSLKHFPGHGSSAKDSHKGIVDVTNSYSEEELIPFKKLIQYGVVDTVMVGHIINKNIDSENPASLSSLFIKNILRNQLKFQGVVLSDDIQMGAIAENYGFNEALIRSINAGSDMIIISNNFKIYDESAPYQAQEAIFQAVKNGAIPVERIIESSDRIYELKKKFSIIK